MSRVPWQLPTQKGTEVFPETTRVPVKVVVTVPPTADPQASRRVYERNQAVVSKFYLKAAQQHSLGITDVSAMQMQLPGLKLRYSNIQGVEAVFVEVADTVTKPSGGEEKKGWEWDFLLVDIEVPIWTTGYAEKPFERAAKLLTAARMVAPGAADPEDAATASDQQLFDSDLQQSAGDEPTLQFGGASRAEQIGTTTDEEDAQVSSLLVDIRPYHTLPVIELDLYARLDPYGIDREIRAVIVRSVRSGVPDARCFYIGGSTTLTYIATHYPTLNAGITSTQAVIPTGDIDSLFPWPYDRATITDDLLRDNSLFSPDTATLALHSPGAEWISDNADIFFQHLWGATNTGQWADVSSPFSWAGGSWTSGNDMPTWQATFNSISGPGSGEELPPPFDAPGLGAITQQGAAFWYFDESGEPRFADYGGAGNLTSGAPPNVAGVPDTGTAYAEIFGWGQVYNTYIYQLTQTLDTPEAQAETTIKASAFRGFGFEGSGAVWRWSKRRADRFSDLIESLGDDPLEYAMWEIEDKYPDRFETGPLVPNDTIPELIVTSEIVSENPNGGQYLGRLTFFQEQGAFAFKPAE